LFTNFAAKWQQCGGVDVILPGDDDTFTEAISDVRVADSVLAATVSVKSAHSVLDSTIPHARAIGVLVNCLIDVEISIYSSQDLADQGSADIRTSGIGIAHILMDKASKLA
jgi:methylmalonyl-CoA mutase cobalamin-binding subunit